MTRFQNADRIVDYCNQFYDMIVSVVSSYDTRHVYLRPVFVRLTTALCSVL